MHERGDRPSVSSLLAALDPRRLARGFELRPDLLVPRPPTVIGDLAGRVAAQRSVALAMAGCDRWCRQLVDVALVLRGPTSAPAMAALVRTAAGEPASEEQVDGGVERLSDRLLLFVDGHRRIWLNPGLVAAVPRPCGLGPPACDLLSGLSSSALRGIVDAIGAETVGRSKADLTAAIVKALTDGGTVGRLLATAPPDAVAVLRQARFGYVDLPYLGWSRSTAVNRAGGAHAWLLAHALLVDRTQGYGYGRAEVPREVALALRGGFALTAGAPDAPPLASVAVDDPVQLDRRAAGRAGTTVRSVARVLGLLEAAPATPLKDGGLGPREAGRLAKALDLTTEEAFVLLEVAAAADLVSAASYEPVMPTTAADAWLDTTPGDRWLDLAQAWLDAPGIPSISGRKAPTGKVIPGLVNVSGIDGRTLRRATLDLLASAGPGQRTSGDLAGAVAWARPAALEGLADVAADLVAWTMAEAAELGLVIDGALTSVGRLLHTGDGAAARQHASSLLVEAPAEVILQADLTAVVDAAAAQGVLDELRLLADEESAGSAVVLRFSAGSVRRALDAGREAEGIIAFLAAHAARGVPQPLEYLVTDTARRWGSVRIGVARSYVRSDDPVLLEEAIRHRRLAKLGLRLLAPTVAVSEREPAPLLVALRDAGFLPVEEDAGGVILRAAPRQRAAVPSGRSTGRAAPPAEPVDVRAVAEALLAAGHREPKAPPHPVPRTAPLDDLEDQFGPSPARELAALFDDALDDDMGDVLLDDELDPLLVFDTLVGLIDTAAVVELRIADPDTGREYAVTGPVVDVDLNTGLVTLEREPDGAMAIIRCEDVFDIRALRGGDRR